MDAGVRIRLEESLKTHIGAKRKRNIASVVSWRSALSSDACEFAIFYNAVLIALTLPTSGEEMASYSNWFFSLRNGLSINTQDALESK